jgi:hypothetical protein
MWSATPFSLFDPSVSAFDNRLVAILPVGQLKPKGVIHLGFRYRWPPSVRFGVREPKVEGSIPI